MVTAHRAVAAGSPVKQVIVHFVSKNHLGSIMIAVRQNTRFRNILFCGLALLWAVLGESAIADDTAQPADAAKADEGESSRLLKMYLSDAVELAFYRDSDHRQPLVLKEKPVYIWQNRIRSGGQYGAVYVWTYRGCPEVVGSIFSNPASEGGRAVLHELHAVSSERLAPQSQRSKGWAPRAGVERRPIAGSPEPADSAKSRLVQMRSLAREFSAHSISPYDDGRWELRLLPQPLYRYESTNREVIDGAVFAYVTSAGTDPEVLLLIEARRSDDAAKWYYAAARFSDFNLFVEHRGQQVWQSLRDDDNPWDFNKPHTYSLYNDRIIDE